MRKVFTVITILTLILLSAPVAQGATTVVKVDGKSVSFDVNPINEKGRLLVPMRQIFEALGAIVTWDDKTQTVMAGKENTLITMKIGQFTAQKNQQPVQLDAAPKLVRWRTMVPLRFVGEALGATVTWDPKTNTVEITSPKPITDIVKPPAIDDTLPPTDLSAGLGAIFGNIGGFSDYKFTPTIEENTIILAIEINNADGIQKWQNLDNEAKRVFLKNIVDKLCIWYPKKSVFNVKVTYTIYSEKSKAEYGDTIIEYNNTTRLWKVKHVTQIGSANYFKTMDYWDINPFN